jgi:hypothetical protein
MVGTTAALIGLIAAKAGSDIVSAKMQSNASKKAAATQNVAVDKSLAMNDKMYAEQKALQEPYLAAGRNAMGTFADLMGPMKMPTQPLPWDNRPRPTVAPPQGPQMGFGGMVPQPGSGLMPGGPPPMPGGAPRGPAMMPGAPPMRPSRPIPVNPWMQLAGQAM